MDLCQLPLAVLPLAQVKVLLAYPQVHCDLLDHWDLVFRRVLHYKQHFFNWIHFYHVVKHQLLVLPKQKYQRTVLLNLIRPQHHEPARQLRRYLDTVQHSVVAFGVCEIHDVQLH